MTAAPEAAARVMTADELPRLPGVLGQRYELAQGELKTMTPASFEHGDITLESGMRLRGQVREAPGPSSRGRDWLLPYQ